MVRVALNRKELRCGVGLYLLDKLAVVAAHVHDRPVGHRGVVDGVLQRRAAVERVGLVKQAVQPRVWDIGAEAGLDAAAAKAAGGGNT